MQKGHSKQMRAEVRFVGTRNKQDKYRLMCNDLPYPLLI